MDTNEKLTELADKAMDGLRSFLDAEDHTGKDIGVARVATSILNAWTRYQQARNAEKALVFMVARELAQDKEQLQEYIRASLPIVRFIPLE